jgi:hypothetical protein
MNNYFGPLSKEYCLYFYILSILSFIFFVVGLFSFVVIIIKKYKSLESTFYMNNIFTLFNILNKIMILSHTGLLFNFIFIF